MNLKNLFFSLYYLYYPKVSKRNNKNFSDWRFFPFATGASGTGGAPWAANISENFRKNSKRLLCYNKGLGGTWFMKKTRSKKSRDTVPLMGYILLTGGKVSLAWLWWFSYFQLQHNRGQLASGGLQGVSRGFPRQGRHFNNWLIASTCPSFFDFT
jgi:hypothetical protein